jgi:hypothetical protein
MDPVLDYIQDKGWEHRLEGDEVILKRCVYCGRETWKLYVNRKNRLYQCFRASCGVKGHISALKKHVGDVIEVEGLEIVEEKTVDFTQRTEESYHKLIESDEWIRYLDDHGITLEAINRFKLGLHKQQKNFWLYILPLTKEPLPTSSIDCCRLRKTLQRQRKGVDLQSSGERRGHLVFCSIKMHWTSMRIL